MDSNKKEMEQIQRGLEAFLEKEIENSRDSRSRRQKGRQMGSAKGSGDGEEIQIIGQFQSRRQPQRDWEEEDPDSEGWLPEEDEELDSEDWEDLGDWEDGTGRWEKEEVLPGRRRTEYEAETTGRRRSGYEEEPPQRRKPEYEGEFSRRRRPEYESASSRRAKPRQENASTGRKSREYREYEEEETPAGKKTSQRKRNSQKNHQGEEDSGMGKGKQKAEKKRRKKKSWLKKFLVAVALIAVLLGVGLYQLVGAVYGKMNYRELEALVAEPMKEDGVVNILLIGNDSRENGEDGRSDAMILLSISSKTKTIYMTSLLRDIYVEIPGYGGDRLNSAYSYGGAQLLMDTIELNFDIPVNRYMLVNFEAFANLVDAVDGVDLELSKGEIEYVNGYLWEYNMLTGRPDGTDNMDPSVADNGPVTVHLNGPQALAYSRNRYMGTDFGRTERQRKILTAVIGKLPMAVLTNAKGLVDGLMPNLTTNLTQNECFRLSLMAGKLFTYDIISDSIPQPDTYRDVTIRGMQVLEVDFERNISYLKTKLYGE